jgi:hypothetical protein
MTEQEINEAVARKLGWKEVPDIVINGQSTGAGWWPKHFGDPLDPAKGAHRCAIPNYCTNIAAAMECLKDIGIVQIAKTGKLWSVLLFGTYYGEAEELSMAICIAFFKLSSAEAFMPETGAGIGGKYVSSVRRNVSGTW